MPNSFSTSNASGNVATSGTDPRRIVSVPEAQIRQLYSVDPQSGFPKYVAIRPVKSDGKGMQGWEAEFYPQPDDDYTFSYRYAVIPTPLTEESPYPIGGRQYAELLLQSCLMVAEERETKASGGPASSRFLDRLGSAIKLDLAAGGSEDSEIWEDLGEGDSLTITRAYLKRLIGTLMGFGASASVWTPNETRQVEVALQTGLRKFYHPVPIEGERNSYSWKFLHPIFNLSMTSGQSTYDLPSDFAMLDGDLCYSPGAAVLYPPIRIVGENQIRNMLAREESSARPLLAAIRAKSPSDTGTEYEILFWPVPDSTYALNGRYAINPRAGSDDTAVPHGGQFHAQTIIEACLAAAEEMMGKPGIHTQLFKANLRSSVSHDRQTSTASFLGYNGDTSDRPSGIGDWHDLDENIVVYNGYTP